MTVSNGQVKPQDLRRAPRPLAIIEPDDLSRLKKAMDVLQARQFETAMLYDGYNAMWRTYREKYDLPKEFSFDWSNGAVFEKAEATVPQVIEQVDQEHHDE